MTVLTEPYTAATTLVAASADGDVVRIDLRDLSGRTVFAGHEVPGRVQSIAAQLDGQPSIVVGASGGLLRWDDAEHKASRDRGVAVTGVAIGEGNLWIADAQGVSSIRSSEEFGTRVPGTGRPATTVTAGPGGAVATHDDGTVTLLAERPAGLALAPGDNSTVASFGPDGELLTAKGDSPRQIEALVAIKPGVPGRDEDGGVVEHRTIRSYTPAASWWPQGEDDESDWYVNHAVMGERFVVAGGQDPLGNAVVLVWDRRSGRPLRRLPLTTGGVQSAALALVTSVAILEDKKLIAAYSHVQESIVLWSSQDWRQVATIDVGPAGGFSVSPDEETIVVAGLSDEQSDTEAGNAKSRLVFVAVDDHEVDHEVTTGTSHRAEFSPDGETIATLSDDDQLRFLTADGRSQVRRPLQLDAAHPLELAWRQDGELLAVSLDDRVVLVDPHQGLISTELDIPDGANAVNLTWSHDGRMLATLNHTESDEGASVAPSPTIFRLDRLRSRMCAVAGSPPTAQERRRWLGSASPRGDLCEPPRAPAVPDARPVNVRALAYQRGDRLLVAGADGKTAPIGTADENTFPRVPFIWSVDGALAWTAEGAVHLLAPGAQRAKVRACASSGVAFDGEELIAVMRDGSAMLRFSVSLGTPTRTAVRGLPAFSASTQGRAGGKLVVAGFETQPERATPSVYFAVDDRGRARRLRSEGPGATFGGGAAYDGGVSAPDGSSVAIVATRSSGACYSPSYVGVADVGNGEVTFHDMPGADDEPQIVRSLGYDRNSDLYAFIAPVCNADISSSVPPGACQAR